MAVITAADGANLSKVEDLFGPIEQAAKPRLKLVRLCLVAGLVMTVLGMACSVVPGVSLVLLSWFIVDKEVSRIESGFLAQSWRDPVAKTKTYVRVGVWLSVLTLLLQVTLLCMGVYTVWAEYLLSWVAGN